MALTSSLHCLDPTLTPFSPFCIAAKKRVLSVNLYHKQPIKEYHHKPIAITTQSATSSMLLKILCKQLWQITPLFEPIGHKMADAFLLIGDQALQQQSIPGYQTTDLATAWYELTGLPFVFARFFKRKGACSLVFERIIEKSYLTGKKSIPQWSLTASKQINLPVHFVNCYYKNLIFEMGQDEERGLNLFLNGAKDADL